LRESGCIPRSWTLGRVAVAAAALAIAGAVAGLAFAWSGVYDVGASRGHWAVTRWLLGFAMESSVETHAAGIEEPASLDDPALLVTGLRHYAGGCAPCHGAPGSAPSPIAQSSVPAAPFLPDTVGAWAPRELFWIVRHGLKYTGMPAWPAPSRDDEVWAVVVALLALPTLSGEGYRRLVRGEATERGAQLEEDARLIAAAGPLGEDLVACARCHGASGQGSDVFPRLAGLGEAYLMESLRGYAIGARPSGIMQPIAAALGEAEMRELARFYAARRPPSATRPAADAALLARGRAVAAGERAGVPGCDACHASDAIRHPLHPPLAAQPARHLQAQLRLFANGARAGTPFADLMAAAVERLDPADAEAAALYYEAQPPPSPQTADVSLWGVHGE
jgi:cytochrome c553